MRRITRGLVLALAVSSLTALPTSPATAADATVTVSSSSTGPLLTQLSTNNAWSGMLDGVPGAVARFQGLKAPLVRIHAGTDGDPAALPEAKQGSWSFAALDRLVNDSTAGGGDVLMNVRYAPDWMWTCTTYGASGTIRDTTFKTYAAYLARLVSYYNKGSMTTESGQVITNPAGDRNRIVYWEPWNEPDLNNETPCAPPSGVGLTAAQYVTMWNAVAPAMLAVDPGLKLVGPATAGGQFGSGGSDDYITTLMTGAKVQPAALSFHGYGYWDNTVPDKWLFDGDGTDGGGGIPVIADTAAAVHAKYPAIPIWITEVNVNAAWGNDSYARPWGPLGAAWWGSVVSQLAPRGVGLIHQYLVMESPQFGLLDDQTGAPLLPYWTFKTLNAAFPAGSTLLTTSSSNPGVQSLAARKPDGSISVLVVNRQLNGATTRGGAGLPATTTVALNGITPTRVTVTQIDKNTSVANGPAAVTRDPAAPLQASLPGFGFAVFSIATAGGSPAPSPTGSPAPSPTGSTPTSTDVGLTVQTPDIQPTQHALLTATAAPGATVELLCYSRPTTAYSVARTVVATNGQAAFSLRPGTNTRCYARDASSPDAASPSVVVNVHTTLSLSAVRSASRAYVFQGRNLPRLAGQLITLYRVDGAGTQIRTATTRTDSTGIWRLSRTFTGSGTFTFLVKTTQTLNNAPGVSAPLRLTVR